MEPLYSITVPHSSVCPTSCYITWFLTTILVLQMFASWNFFPSYPHRSCHIFVPVFKVSWVSFPQTSLLGAPCAIALPPSGAVPWTSTTWCFLCILPGGLTVLHLKESCDCNHLFPHLGYKLLEGRDNTLFSFILIFISLVVPEGIPCT